MEAHDLVQFLRTQDDTAKTIFWCHYLGKKTNGRIGFKQWLTAGSVYHLRSSETLMVLCGGPPESKSIAKFRDIAKRMKALADQFIELNTTPPYDTSTQHLEKYLKKKLNDVLEEN
jgi:hypothetical protein